jgi:hypothetical protein
VSPAVETASDEPGGSPVRRAACVIVMQGTLLTRTFFEVLPEANLHHPEYILR